MLQILGFRLGERERHYTQSCVWVCTQVASAPAAFPTAPCSAHGCATHATGPARCTIDAAVAAATEDHVLWWRRLNERRERVVDAARSEGVARAKVLRILDEMALAVL